MKNFIYILFVTLLLTSCEEVTTDDITCSISGLEIAIGDCNADGTYNLTLNFNHDNASNDLFDVYIRDNVSLGYFQLSDLPLTIENFEISESDFDFIQVCINDSPNCCAAVEFEAPNCEEEETNNCDISNFEVEVGDCNNDGSYSLTLNFNYDNADDNNYFDVYTREDVFLGYYQLSDLPLTIDNFEMSQYDYDYIKICINDSPNCCAEVGFQAPNCEEVEEETNDCNISGLEVTIINCNSDGTYNLYLNFNHNNTNNDYFDVYIRDNESIGYYGLSSLPVIIQGFEMSGLNYDYIQVCINDNPNCCSVIEFTPPNCDQ